MKKIRHLLRTLGEDSAAQVHVCVYAAPFGIIPLELDEVYPLSQHETTLPLDLETVNYVAAQTANYIKNHNYKAVVVLNDRKLWQDTVKNAAEAACKEKGLCFTSQDTNVEGTREMLNHLAEALQKGLTQQ
jgi:predicted RNA-binding protein